MMTSPNFADIDSEPRIEVGQNLATSPPMFSEGHVARQMSPSGDVTLMYLHVYNEITCDFFLR